MTRTGQSSHEHTFKLLENALREVRKTRFDPTKLLNAMRAWSWETGYNLLALPLLFHCSTQVQFVGEEAVDTGGGPPGNFGDSSSRKWLGITVLGILGCACLPRTYPHWK